jgi:hypothetical protein
VQARAGPGPDYGDELEDGPTRRGYQKPGCKFPVTQAFRPSQVGVSLALLNWPADAILTACVIG